MEDKNDVQKEESGNVTNNVPDSIQNESVENIENQHDQLEEEIESVNSAVETETPSEEVTDAEEITEVAIDPVHEESTDILSEEEGIPEKQQEEETVLENREEIRSEEEVLTEEGSEDMITEDPIEDVSTELAEDFDKELHSAKDQTKSEEEREESTEEEIIPDYQSFTPEELINELEQLINDNPFETIKGRVAAIKLAFLEHEKAAKTAFLHEKEKNPEEEVEEVDFVYPYTEQFNNVFNLYRQKKAKFMEDLEKEKEVNLENKKRILDELKELLVSEQNLKVTYDRFRSLQDKWKNIGMVPKQEVATLWNNYHFLIEKFFDKVRIHRELKQLDLKKNMELKIALCEKAEELLLEEKVSDAFKKLQEYHKQWKDIGAIPDENKEEIWERFKLASDTINHKHREFYESLRSEYDSNIQTKNAICEKVEEIANESYESVGEWNKKADELNELFKLWKSVGPIGKKQNDELWERYSKSMDIFYKNKKEFFGKIKEMHMDNYNKKINLCVEAEALQDNTDWKTTTQEFIRLQNEWKKIGPISTKTSEKIWKRFRTACDHFFNNKEAHFSSRSAAEPENLKAKEALIEELANYEFTNSKAENLDKLKEFQRRWFAIGFVPIKEKERLQKEYRKILNDKMKQLNISSFEVSGANDFRYYRGDQESGIDDKGLRKEITFLQNKIAAMQDEINLWENNLGFLASSKNADLLKQEFEKKIQREKNELELNIAKLKFLRQELAKEEENKVKK